MSFTEFLQPDPLLTREQVMGQLIQMATARDMPDKRGACIIAGMTISQEAGVRDNDPPHERRFWCPANHADPESFRYQHDSVSDDGRSVGYFQQQKGPQGQLWWGTTEQEMRLQDAAGTFMGRLKRIPYSAATAQSANDAAQAIQQSGVPHAYAQWFDDINRLYDKVAGTIIAPPWRGDPVWLRDVIAAEGVATAETEGWLGRGHGDFGTIWGVVIHHTGGDNTPVSEISHHPQLGLCSQIHLAKDGLATMCGVGIAWHAGVGSYPGIAEDSANQVTIGIENVNLPPRGAPHRTGWSDVQYTAMVKTVAAILRKLGHNSSRVISHQEWGGRKQGKWDPGSIDMNVFRADVQARLGGTQPPPPPPPPTGDPDYMAKVPQEQWNAVHAVITQKRKSRAIYRTPGEKTVGDFADLISNVDAMEHMELVERLAITYSDDDSIAKIVAVAAGEGADPKDTWAVQHARDVIERNLEVFRGRIAAQGD